MNGNERATLRVSGMTCASCAQTIESAVGRVDGVTEANVNLAVNKLQVTYDPARVSLEAVADAVRRAGYEAEAPKAPAETRERLRITGMTCASCVSRVEKALNETPGVASATVNLATERADVAYDASEATHGDLVKAVENAGYGVAERQAPQARAQKTPGEERLRVTGMTCASCVGRVEKALTSVAGVESATVNLATERADVKYDPDRASHGDLVKAVENAGYGVAEQPAAPQVAPGEGLEPEAAPAETDVFEREMKSRWRRFVIGALFTGPLFLLSMGTMLAGVHVPYQPFLEFALATPVMAYSAQPFFQGAWKALRNRTANMDTLVAVGSSAAYGYSVVETFVPFAFPGHALYYETAAVIVVLIILGKYMEARSKSRASGAITRLLELAPTTARVERDGAWVEVPAVQVQVGDRILVKPGEKVPVDARVLEGRSSVDESMVTGESIPVPKEPESEAIGGTVNGNGVLTLEATRVGEDTMLSQITRLVEDAQAKKAPIQRIADVVSAYFVPTVIGFAILTFLFWNTLGAGLVVGTGADPFTFGLLTSIAVLIIACPCAMGLATPTAIMVGTGKGAENGILIKSGEALERSRDVEAVILDKTGTITEGKPRLTDVRAYGVDEEDLLLAAAAAEAGSEHPLAEAIVAAADERGLNPPAATDVEAVPGKGLRATVEGTALVVGNPRFLREEQVDLAAAEADLERLRNEGKTVIGVAADGTLVGLVAIADPVKATSAEAVAAFREQGHRVIMLTGDNRQTAEAIAQQVGITEVRADVLPGEKADVVRRLQEEGANVAMVGDGINDAPALAQADLGIAMGAGTDVAIETGDVVLVKNDLRDAAAAITLSRKTFRKIKQNLFWAFAYNVLLIPLAAGVLYWFPLFGDRVLLHPMLAAAAMAFSSVSVVTNSMLLRRARIRPAGAASPRAGAADGDAPAAA